MNRRRLKDELAHHSSTVAVGDLLDTLAEANHDLCPSRPVDRLLCRPDDAKDVVAYVRRKLRARKLLTDMIL
jgi:hypothetical protein